MEASKRPAENGENGDSITNGKKAKLDADCGVLLFCGTTEWQNAPKPGKLKEDNYHSKNNIHEPMFIAALKDVRIRHVGSSPEASHVVVVDETGTAWSWGNNEYGQLGQGDQVHRRIPTKIPGTGPGENTIVMVALGTKHTLLLNSQGQVLSCGDNSDGECALGDMKTKNVALKSGTEEVETCSIPLVLKPTLINYSGPPIIKISAGSDYSMFLDLDGCVWTVGSQEFGKCGTGTDGAYNSTDSKVKMKFAGICTPFKVERCYERDNRSRKTKSMQMMKVKSISAGSHHACIVDELGRVFSWGAGSYGRTGLGDTMDTLTPTWVQSLDHPRGKIESVACGYMMTVLTGKTPNTIFMAGVIDNVSKEANMTPKQFYDFGDANFVDVGFWKKGFTCVGEDGNVTLCNKGPCYGEIGNGERFRTQGQPKKSKEFEYAHILKVGTGANYAVYVMRDTEEEDKDEMEEFDVLEQEEYSPPQ